MRLGHDIWHQVIQYFEYDGEYTNGEKRTTLLNLALTSRLLSGLALAALWRNMNSMEHIVHTINSFTPHEEDPFLTWVGDEDGGGYWEFWRKPDGDQVYQRVKEYFSRIRHFWAYGDYPSEFALWPILIAWFWKGEPLLPNLQRLAISFDSDDSTSYYPLTLMVPSTLRFIATMNVRSYRHVVEFYQHLLSHDCSPDELEYVGDLRFPPILTFFGNLNKLVVKGPFKRDRHKTPFSLVGLLQSVPFLCWLEIDLGTLQNELEGPLEPFEHPYLETLILEGLTQELHPFLSSKITCPLVERLSLKIRFTAELTWKFLFTRVAVIFPNTNHFSLQVLGPIEGVPRLIFFDLDVLLPQPMEVFSLEGVPNKLLRRDLYHMLHAWPELCTLILTGGKMRFNAQALLSTIHTNKDLHTLHLPLDFIPLGSPLVLPLAPVKRSPLRRLYIASPSRFPPALKEKVILAQNLFILLPELKMVEMKDKNIGAGTNDFREIIRGMQAVVRSV